MAIKKDVSATEFLKAASTTAEHFGFTSAEQLKAQAGSTHPKLSCSAGAADRKLDDVYGFLTAGIAYYANSRPDPEEPALFYTLERTPRSQDVALGLHIIGVDKSIAEAILIQALRALALEIGISGTTVRINSIGDRDSIARYNRELNNFLKRRLEEMSSGARELIKDHPYLALMHMLDHNEELGFRAPSPMEHLSDPSRKHFREVIEYLDMSDTPYEIDPKFLGHHECYSDTLFAIEPFDPESGTILPDAPLSMRGGRYTTFAEKHLKQPIHAVGAVAILHNKKAPQRTPKSQTPTHAAVHVVQLGFGPKVRTLMLVDELRRAGILVKQNLASDSLSTQLRKAEMDDAAFTIIIGQKEYVDGTVILRDMQSRTQETVPIESVANRLKKALKM